MTMMAMSPFYRGATFRGELYNLSVYARAPRPGEPDEESSDCV